MISARTRSSSARSQSWSVVTWLKVVPSGTALFAFIYADDDFTQDGVQGGFPKTLSVDGTAPGLPFAFPGLTYTPTGNASDDGWNLVGNPVLDTIDWDAAGWVKTSLSNTIYAYDTGVSEYLTWNGTVGTLTEGRIPAGQGFWVQATAANPALTAPEAARVSARPVSTPAEAEEVPDAEAHGGDAPDVIELRLSGPTTAGNRGSSLFVVFGIEGAQIGADPFDAYALVPPSPAYVLGSARRIDGESLGIQALPILADLAATEAFDVSVSAEHLGLTGTTMTWTWPQAMSPDSEWTATLTDTETGTVVDLSSETSYPFEIAGPAARTARPETATDAAEISLEPARPAPLGTASPVRAARKAGTFVGTPFVPLALLGRGAGGALARSATGDDRFTLRLARRSAVASESGAPAVSLVRAPFPNPAPSASRLSYDLAEVSDVDVAVYDLLGRRVLTVQAQAQPTGSHETRIDSGSLASGVYVVQTRLSPQAGQPLVFTHKLTVVR